MNEAKRDAPVGRVWSFENLVRGTDGKPRMGDYMKKYLVSSASVLFSDAAEVVLHGTTGTPLFRANPRTENKYGSLTLVPQVYFNAQMAR